jgi:hypothetical protein
MTKFHSQLELEFTLKLSPKFKFKRIRNKRKYKIVKTKEKGEERRSGLRATFLAQFGIVPARPSPFPSARSASGPRGPHVSRLPPPSTNFSEHGGRADSVMIVGALRPWPRSYRSRNRSVSFPSLFRLRNIPTAPPAPLQRFSPTG